MPTIGICVGHSRKGDSGASNTLNVSEWNFNAPLAIRICEILKDAGYSAFVVNRYDGTSYGRAMDYVAALLKEKRADVAIELHFNSATASSTGYEFLHWHSSKRSKLLASKMHDAFAKQFPNQRSRGLKAITPEDRGGSFLSKTHCPACIVEPFFSSNPIDTDFFNSKREELARAYAMGIINWLAI